MKLQHLIIIFLVIVLPVVLVMSQYTSLQIDTLAKKTQYDTALLGAAFDTMAAFELNTINSKSSSVVGEEIRDIEAIISTFTNSLSSSMNMVGVDNDYILSYVPAMVFSLYDGYYIYSVSGTTGERELKPYVYYTKTYKNGANTNITLAYSLDNYVSIYGTYKDLDGTIKNVSAAGYLVIPSRVEISADFSYITTTKEDGSAITKVIAPGNPDTNPDVLSWIKYKYGDGANEYTYIDKETIYENYAHSVDRAELKIDKEEETTDAMMYYYEAYHFTQLYNKVISALGTQDKNKLYISASNDPENETSMFMNEKINVIKDSITENLNAAIYNYEGNAGTECSMPQLTGEDWDKIINDISIIAFLKNIPIGTTQYNNYVVVNSTTNQKYCNAKAIDFVGYTKDVRTGEIESKGYYHKITCDELINEIETNANLQVVGYASVDFERYKYSASEEKRYYYYYKHNEYADYNCEVDTIKTEGVATIKGTLTSKGVEEAVQKKILQIYYTAVGRVRHRLVKPSSYIKLTDTEKEFKVTYMPNGGNWSNGDTEREVESEAGRIRVNQEEPRLMGKKFLGWSKNSATTMPEIKTGDTIYLEKDKELTLYAIYAEQFIIEYDANGGANAPNADTKIENIDYKISSVEPIREHYIFLGWSTDPTATEADPSYNGGSIYTGNADLKLYAVWANEIVEVTFFGKREGLNYQTYTQRRNESSPDPIILNPAGGLDLNWDGYELLGWSTNPSATEPDPSYAPGTYYYGDDLNLYAVWKEVTYTIEYNANGGDPLYGDLIDPNRLVKEHNRAYKIPEVIPTRELHTFKHWSTSLSPEIEVTDIYEPGDWYTINESLRLYAIWEGETYDIVYHANGGENAPEKEEGLSKQYDKVLSREIPTREGYNFKGWSTDKYATEAEYTIEQIQSPEGAIYTGRTGIILYAVWERCTYTIIYIVDDVEFARQQKTYGININIIEEKPEDRITELADGTKRGEYFSGWSKTENPTAEDINYYPNQEFEENQNTTLYAVWQRIEETMEIEHMLEYDANGGEWPTDADGNQVTVSVGFLTGDEVRITEVQPTRVGYEFRGWSRNPEATEPEYRSGDLYLEDTGAVLYAVWEANKVVKVTISWQTYESIETTEHQCNVGQKLKIVLPGYEVDDETTMRPPAIGAASTAVSLRSGDATIEPIITGAAGITGYYVIVGVEDSVVRIDSYFRLNFNANAGRNTVTNMPESTYYICGDDQIVSSQVPVRSGYIFKGWATYASATTPLCEAGGSFRYEIPEELTLYAVWTDEIGIEEEEYSLVLIGMRNYSQERISFEELENFRASEYWIESTRYSYRLTMFLIKNNTYVNLDGLKEDEVNVSYSNSTLMSFDYLVSDDPEWGLNGSKGRLMDLSAIGAAGGYTKLTVSIDYNGVTITGEIDLYVYNVLVNQQFVSYTGEIPNDYIWENFEANSGDKYIVDLTYPEYDGYGNEYMKVLYSDWLGQHYMDYFRLTDINEHCTVYGSFG